jgi:hypothetical protein
MGFFRPFTAENRLLPSEEWGEAKLDVARSDESPHVIVNLTFKVFGGTQDPRFEKVNLEQMRLTLREAGELGRYLLELEGLH